MSAIGDYIHYTSRGYLEHGTTPSGTFKDWQSQKQEIFRRLKANQKGSLTLAEQRDLEDVLNSLIGEDSQENFSDIHSEIQNRMVELFGESLQDIDWTTGDVTMSKNKNAVIGRVKSTNQIETVIKKLYKLEDIIRQESQKEPLPRGLKTRIKELQKYYKDLARELAQAKEANGLDSSKAIMAREAKTLREKRRYINELIKEYAAYPAVNLQKGTFFENLIAYAPYVAQSQAEEAIGQVIGDVVEDVSFNTNNFASQFLTDQITSEVLEKTTVSQGKIDVMIQWNGKDIGISAKNVNMNNFHYIHVLSGSSLLYMLQDIDADFVNHFLNLYAQHGKNRDGSSSAPYDLQLNARKSAILQEVKLILLYKAMTGDTNGRSSANLFVVNDAATGKVRVIDMYTLLEKVSKENIQGIQFNGKTFNEKIRFANIWNQGSPQQRISGLLLDVHAQKVTASLNPKFLK